MDNPASLLAALQNRLYQQAPERHGISGAFLKALAVVLAVVRDLAFGQLMLRATSLVYTTLLSIVPMLALTFSVSKAFGVHGQIEPALQRFMEPLGPKGVEITTNIMRFIDNMHVGVLGSVGLGMLLFTAVSTILKIESSINTIWHVKTMRPLSQRISYYLCVMLLGPILVVSALGLNATLASSNLVQMIISVEPFGHLAVLAGRLLPYVLVIGLFLFLYLFMPNTRVRLLPALTSALVAGICWQSAGWAFARFVAGSTQYAAIYSSLAILIIFMIWLYVSWIVVLVGASVGFYMQHTECLMAPPGEEPHLSAQSQDQLALAIMQALGERYLQGSAALRTEELARRFHTPGYAVDGILEALAAHGIVVRLDKSEPTTWMPGRDLSNITTPPPNRYPVQTELERFNADIIREAIEFEMSRNGQVFFINNRIQNIYEIENLIRREVPGVRVAVGHGQMEPDKLERIILDFVNYEYDVLVATTIVENGIDVSNANTIIVNNAHQFGLSELHQLRGRVGRSNRKAFCYLLAPPLSTLTAEARRRLQAIESFAELGSGMHIAMQDLDIRGAGNMLGAEQSGFIADLGYETYQKILEEAVDELKTDEFADLYAGDDEGAPNTGDNYVRETFVESDLELMFPPTYIPNDSERVGIYRELDTIETDEALSRFVASLQDRFGRIPTEGEELIRVVSLRRMARRLGIEKVVLKRGAMALYLPSDSDSPYYQSIAFGRLLGYIGRHPKSCVLREQNAKRSILIRNVASVAAAVRCLTEVEHIEPDAA